MKKTVVFILPNLNAGGAERVIINIIKTLEKEKYEIKLLLFTKKGVFLKCIPSYVEIISLHIKRSRYTLYSLIQSINNINPDIVFSTLNRINILVLMASFFFRKKIKIYIREPSLPSYQMKYQHLSKFYYPLIKLLYPRAYKIIAQTAEMKDEIYKYYCIPKEKIIVFKNPLDKKLIKQNLENTTNPFDKKFINLVAVGRLSNEKGYDILIEAMRHVVKENRYYRLYIVGEGKDRQNLEGLIKKYNMEEYIFLLGFQINPHKFVKYANALILSSRWEGMPNVVLESLFIGTPVIATKVVKVLNELIVEGENGYLVDIGNVEELSKKILDLDKLLFKFNKNNFDSDNIILFDTDQ